MVRFRFRRHRTLLGLLQQKQTLPHSRQEGQLATLASRPYSSIGEGS